MSNHRFRKGVGYVEDKALERYHAYEASIPRRRWVKSAWQKAAVLAACLALLLSTVLFRTPPEQMENLLHMTTQDVVSAWRADGCMPAAAYIGWGGELESFWTQDTRLMPTDQYLPVYKVNYDLDGIYNKEEPLKELDEQEFTSWLDQKLSCVESTLGIGELEYEITSQETGLSATIRQEEPAISASQSNRLSVISITARDSGILKKGKPLQICADLKDSHGIRAALAQIKDQICGIVGKSFSDIEFGVDSSGISAYFFNLKDHLLNNRYQRGSVATDFIYLTFKIEKEEAGITTLTCTYITCWEYRADYDEMYEEQGQVRRLSLTEATERLKKGYVFGGSMCCECAKREMDFSAFDKVELVYQKAYFKDEGYLAVPVYMFYKQTVSSRTGDPVIVMAQLPAFEMEGLEEFFESIAKDHQHWYE